MRGGLSSGTKQDLLLKDILKKKALIMMKYLLQWLDFDHKPDKAYKVVKATIMDFIKPRAWYDTLATYLLSNGFQRGQIDQTLFIKSQQGHILLVQIYVDDIIFGSTKKELSAEALTDDNGTVKINATIDGHSLSITERSLRRHLKLDDQDGINSLSNYRDLLLNCAYGLSTDLDNPKKTAWEQFSSNIAVAVICLATNRKFNFSRMIFDHMVSNISSPHKFLMYPRFVQLCLDMQRHKLQQHTRVYSVPSLTMKLSYPSALPSNSISSPEPTPTQPSPTQPSPQPSPIQPSPTQLSPTQPGSEYHPPTPHDSPLHAVHSHGSDEGSLKLQELMNLINTLSDRIGVLEADVTKTKENHTVLLILKLIPKEVTPTEVIQDQEGSEKVSDEVSTAGLKKGPVSEEVPTWDEEERKRAMDAAKSTEKIDWNDPSVIRYHSLKMKPKAQSFERSGILIQNIKPMWMKSKEVKSNISLKERTTNKIVEEEALPQGEREEVVKEPAAKRKKAIPRKTTRKRQKLEEDAEKDELKGFLDIVPIRKRLP
ncbi:putative ribonuclease H-like domain-containing protein [Tanacetum coccineum]